MEHIGKYVIQQAVLTSGFSRLFLGQDPDLQVPVAIKLFNPIAGDDGPLSPAQQLTRFMAEARILAGFDHPYIVAVKALEHMGDGRPYFVMPFMAASLPFELGKDAPQPASTNERDRPRRVALPRALGLLRQLGSALLVLHRRGMVHRFVRPSNILLTAREGGALKLCDFSMVKLPDRNLPMPDHWLGAADYTAPEQLDQATSVTARADVYSFGLLAYRMISGRLPEGREEAADLGDSVPPLLADLVRRCTSPDPAARPAHAGEVLQFLDRIQVPQAPKPVVQVVARRAPQPAPG
jgi:serine/threonine-protein kinase